MAATRRQGDGEPDAGNRGGHDEEDISNELRKFRFGKSV